MTMKDGESKITEQMIANLSVETWVATIRDFLAGRDDMTEQLEVLTAAGRSAWKGFFDLKPDGRFLVLGCGTGNVIQNLAPHVSQVHGMDEDAQNLRFAQKRLAIFNPDDHVTFLAGAANGRLPFATGLFDGVIMADSAALGDRHRLAEARRVLRDDGQVFIIADNRFSLSLPVGWWDRWSVAPRPMAALARMAGLVTVWWRKRNGERSLPGLRRVVKRAGFSAIQVVGLWPGRQALEEIVLLRGRRQTTGLRAPLSVSNKLEKHELFLPTHGLLAQACGAPRDSTYDRIFATIARQLADPGPVIPVYPTRMIVTRKDKLIVLADRGDDRLVVRIPFGPAAAAAEARNAVVLAKLEASRPGLGPRILGDGAIDGIEYRVESLMPGMSLGQGSDPGSMLPRVEALLEDLNPSAGLISRAFEGAHYEALVEDRLARVFPFLSNDDLRERVRAFFRDRLHGATLPFGLVHGDFSRSNIHLSGEGQAGLIDWEAASFDDLPMLDAIGFLESVNRGHHPSHSLADGISALAKGVFQSPAQKRFLSARYERQGIDPACHVGLVYLRWLRQVDYLLPYWLRYHPDGQQRYIHQVVERMLQIDISS